MSGQSEIWAEAYRRNLLPPEKKVVYEEALRRGLVQGPERSLGDRFLDNVRDGWQRSGLGNIIRSADPGDDGLLNFRDLSRVRDGSPIDRVLDATVGDQREWFSGGAEVPSVGTVLAGRGMRGTPRAAREDARRQLYAARAASDPISNPAEGAAYFAGQVAGAGISPENWIGGGAIGQGRSLAVRLAGRASEQALIAGASDIALQTSDIGAGIEDAYNPMQTLLSTGIGATIGTAIDAVRPASPMVQRAYTDPIEPPRVASDSVAAALDEVDASAGTGAVTEPEVIIPDFASVRPMERRGLVPDTRRAIDEKGVPGVVADWAQRGYAAVVDDLHPLVRFRDRVLGNIEDLTGAPENLAASADPMKLARGRYDWFNIGHMDILHGVHEYGTTRASTPALADVVTAVGVRAVRAGKTVQDGIDGLGKYAAARRSLTEWDRFDRREIDTPPTLETREQAQAFIDHMDAEEPSYRELSDSLNEYAKGLLKKRLDSGRLDRASYDTALANRDFYTPLRRVMDERGSLSGANSALKGSAVKKFKGSDRQIINPIEVLVQESYRLAQQTRQNDLNLSIVKLAERLNRTMEAAGLDGDNGMIRRIEAPMTKTVISKGELGEKANANAPDGYLDELFSDDIEVFRTGELNEAGRPVLYAWRNGKREAYEILDPEWGGMMLDALTAMTRHQSDMLVDVISAGTTFLSRTITRDPSFLVANFVRDAFSAWTLTDLVAPFEGVRGVVDELTGADSSRLYNLAGGISGGEASAAVGSTLRKQDATELARRFDGTMQGAQMRYLSDMKGLLRLGADAFRLTELTETGTRRTLFSKAFDRARREGMNETDAMLEASFTARDYADFGRHGSKVYAARRMITFLNPWLQGLDKLVRVAITDPASAVGRAHQLGGREEALKAILKPLFRQNIDSLNVRQADKAALKLAVHAWTRMSAMGVFGLALSALLRDDADYREANERNRATHWVVPVGNGVLARIPKPFEAAFMSNIMERAYEGTYGEDETAWGRMAEGLVELFAPPSDAPLVNVAMGLATGVDPGTGRSIIPSGLEDQPPELQYQWWTSQMARHIGDGLGVAPAKVDFFMQTMGGPAGAFAMAMSDATDPDRPAGSWIDLPVARRFLSRSFRGSQDKRDFFDRAGARTGELNRALNGIREYEERRNQPEAARRIFEKLDEPGRIFVMSQRGKAATDRLNPLVRAAAFGTNVGRMIGELNGGPVRGEGLELPEMSAQRRQMVMDQLEKLAVAEMGNAMILTRQPGFQQRNMRDREALWDELETMAPEVAVELKFRLSRGDERAYDYAVVAELWPEVEARLRADGSVADLDDLARQAGRRSRVSTSGREEPDDFVPMNLTAR